MRGLAQQGFESPLLDDFSTWLRSRDTRPFFYHRGYLVVDRERSMELEVVARAAMAAQLRGKVDLVQERLAPFLYNYRALKRRKK